MEEEWIVFKEESHKIMGAYFEVHKEKGYGFLEAVYQECLAMQVPFGGEASDSTGIQGKTAPARHRALFACLAYFVVL